MQKGYQTSEFYITIVTMIVGILVSAGVVVPSHANDLVNAITTLVGGVVTLTPVIVYIINRTWLKSKVLTVTQTITDPVTPKVTVVTQTPVV
jgi:multisubunit Na+/H+ antiporter MnhG subunit